jgi:hypothetical protein
MLPGLLLLQITHDNLFFFEIIPFLKWIIIYIFILKSIDNNKIISDKNTIIQKKKDQA